MVTNGGFLVTKIKQLGDRIFEKVLAEKGIDAFNGAQGRILYVLWQQDGVPIKTVSDTCGLAITSLTTMLAVLALLVFGGGAIFEFALIMFFGVIVGTYSSIFISSSFINTWSKRAAKAAKLEAAK